MTLKELFLMYFDLYKNTLTQSTYISDLSLYNKHILKTHLGNLIISEITFLDLQKYINYLLDNDYKPKTAKNVLSKIKRVLDFAIELNLISKNPAKKVKLPKFDNKFVFNKDYETMKKIIKAFSNENNEYSLFFFFLLHGRRKSEVLKIKWCDIDFINKSYLIRDINNKIRKNQFYYFTEDLYFRILNHYETTEYNNQEDYVFTNSQTQTHYKDLRRPFKKILEKNNLSHMRLHDLRHLIASFSINYLNADINIVSNLLGHSSILTTQKYITVNPKLSKNLLEKIFKDAKND